MADPKTWGALDMEATHLMSARDLIRPKLIFTLEQKNTVRKAHYSMRGLGEGERGVQKRWGDIHRGDGLFRLTLASKFASPSTAVDAGSPEYTFGK